MREWGCVGAHKHPHTHTPTHPHSWQHQGRHQNHGEHCQEAPGIHRHACRSGGRRMGPGRQVLAPALTPPATCVSSAFVSPALALPEPCCGVGAALAREGGNGTFSPKTSASSQPSSPDSLRRLGVGMHRRRLELGRRHRRAVAHAPGVLQGVRLRRHTRACGSRRTRWRRS